MNLYDLTSNWQQVYDMDIDEETWRDTLDAIDESITDKANSIGFIVQNLNADIESYKREEKRLASKLLPVHWVYLMPIYCTITSLQLALIRILLCLT
ncbi:hypothetical protein FGL75_09595 (plasmid) [Weissella hellenica]|uniref:siphovirus Gp157 family protein n=1 Tax=Weissella sagaensis TaxID=2559928 RepID=UPI00069464F3|nr:siphovirus Gp157 family protein [Weissella sagaensis]QEA58148.1 hypothetical protein FGL75_09595 [Weissella hellenica]